jgi:hypothetical protein
MKSKVYGSMVDTDDKLFGHILNDTASIKKHAHQLRRTTHHLDTQAAKCTEADTGIFQHLLQTVTNLSFLCNKLII